MIAVDKEALFCDLWQVYGIREPREIPARKLGMLAAGLGPESRIGRAVSGEKYPIGTVLLANCLDALRTLIWFQTKDGMKGRNRPRRVTDILLEREDEKPEKEIETFASGADFEEARRRLTERKIER